MLCYRCEHRASFLEGGRRPRHECGVIETSKIGCYMFKPCYPVRMERDEGDIRPAHGGYIGARMHALGVVEDAELVLIDGYLSWGTTS